jgi:uncharacterized protein (TIGR02246 family)
MRCILAFFAGFVALLATDLPFIQSQSNSSNKAISQNPSEKPKEAAASATDHAADEKAIRANVAQFVKAFNAGDAKAVAALFTPDGQIEDKDGHVHTGREAIAKTFAQLFKELPDKNIEVFVESIRFLGPDLAIEVGSTKETPSPIDPPEYERYTALHVKRDGKWQMALARDEEGPGASGHEQLQPLAWLIGEWVDDGGSAVVYSTCRWSLDGHFLLQEFDLQLNGREAMKVSQRIGWDPLAKRIRSWVFDSEGGFGESIWSPDGNNWIIKASAVRPDGTTASATNFLTPTGKDGYIWRSTDRIVAEQPQKPVEVKVVRKPPEVKK